MLQVDCHTDRFGLWYSSTVNLESILIRRCIYRLIFLMSRDDFFQSSSRVGLSTCMGSLLSLENFHHLGGDILLTIRVNLEHDFLKGLTLVVVNSLIDLSSRWLVKFDNKRVVECFLTLFFTTLCRK